MFEASSGRPQHLAEQVASMPQVTGMKYIARRNVLKGAAALALLPLIAGRHVGRAANGARDGKFMWGVNLAGAETGPLPGAYGVDYQYPTPENLAYYAMLGFTLVRIPFKWERLQPDQGEPLDDAELGRLAVLVEHARRLGMTLVLDVHNRAQRRLRPDGWRTAHAIGTLEVPAASFVDLWRRLAAAFKSDEEVVFGLMNGPAKHSAGEWLEIANAAIAAIRLEGAKNMLFVPGTAWSVAHSWLGSGNSVMAGVNDPLGNFAIEVHQHLDTDASGTSPVAHSSTVGSERIEAFQDWARINGIKAFLGKYGTGRDAVSMRALMDICDELTANSDVWIGSAAWAGGPRGATEGMFNLEPNEDGKIQVQTDIIRSRAAPGEIAQHYWVGAAAAPKFYLDFARNLTTGTMLPRTIAASGAGGATPRGATASLGARIDKPFSLPQILANIFARPEYTVIAEIRDIAPQSPRFNLIGNDTTALLYYSARSGIGTDLAGGFFTPAPAFDRTRRKCRCALSVSMLTGQVVLGMTGATPVLRQDPPSLLRTVAARSRPILVGAQPGSVLSGFLTRIVGFPVFMGVAEMEANIA